MNECMKVFQSFVSRTLPYIAAFESVQGAFTEGLPLMRYLHDKLEYDTGVEWNLHHVLHNNASVGGASIRKRYFWLVSRIPFGIEEPKIERVPLVHDVIGDLEGMGNTWERQPYRRAPSWWAEQLRSSSGAVDGHVSKYGPHVNRSLDLIPGTGWAPGEIVSTVARRHYEQYGYLPDSWAPASVEKLVANDWRMGFHQPHRWRNERVGRVITGAVLDKVIHPTEDRFVTHREALRIQGFPDDWRVAPLRGRASVGAYWGKGIPVTVGKWIGGWIKAALEGIPGSDPGVAFGEREFKIDVTNTYRAVCHER